MTAKDLVYNGYTSVLLRDDRGQRALWVTDEYLAERSDAPGTYTLNDDNSREPLGADEDIEEIVAQWKSAVAWDEEVNAS